MRQVLRSERLQREPEHSADWYAGAHAEALARRQGRSEASRGVAEYLDAVSMLRPAWSRDRIVSSITRVYTAEWPIQRRLRLAWRLVVKR